MAAMDKENFFTTEKISQAFSIFDRVTQQYSNALDWPLGRIMMDSLLSRNLERLWEASSFWKPNGGSWSLKLIQIMMARFFNWKFRVLNVLFNRFPKKNLRTLWFNLQGNQRHWIQCEKGNPVLWQSWHENTTPQFWLISSPFFNKSSIYLPC